MPLKVSVYPQNRVIWASGYGAVTDDDLSDYVQEYLVEKGLRCLDEIFDLRGADLLDLTYRGLSLAAQAAASTDPDESPTKIGMLVSETHGLGISRMYQTLREDKGGRRNLRIFRELSDVREWMELPEDWSPEVK
jgi:hypothetical protein